LTALPSPLAGLRGGEDRRGVVKGEEGKGERSG